MSDVETLVAQFRRGVPEPRLERPEAIARLAIRTPGPHPSRRTPLAFAVVAVSVAASIAGAVLIANVAGPAKRQRSSADPAIPPARVAWGMTAVVRVTPDPGTPMRQAQQTTRAALLRRAGQWDAAGVEVTPLSGGRLKLRLPGAETSSQISRFVNFTRLSLLDERRSVVARASNLQDLIPAIRREARVGQRTVYYVQEGGGPGHWLGDALRFTSKAPAMKLLARKGPSPAFLAEVPADLSVVALTRQPGKDVLLRDVPAVATANVRAYRFVNPDDAWPGPGTDPAAGDGILVVASDEYGRSFAGRGRFDSTTGTLTLRLRSKLVDNPLVASLAIPDAAASLRVESTHRYGTSPPQPGVPFTQHPASDRPSRSADRWVRVLTADGSHGPVDVVVQEHRGRFKAVFASTRRYGDMEFRSSCLAGIGTPRVVQCSAGAGSGRAGRNRIRTTWMYIGRARDDVAKIEGSVAGGPTSTAVIANGWFSLLVVDEYSGDINDPNDFARPPVSLHAFTATGVEVPIQLDRPDLP